MTKDEQIAMLQETIAILRADRASMIVTLQMALDRIPPLVKQGNGSQRRPPTTCTTDMYDGVYENMYEMYETSEIETKSMYETSEIDVRNARNRDEIDAENKRGPNGPLGGSQTLPVTPLNPPKTRAMRATAEQFDRFWPTYPHSENGSKARARDAWKKLNLEDGEHAILGAANYAQSERVGRGVVMHAATWLNGCNWEQWQDAPPAASSDADRATELERQRLLRVFQEGGMDEDEALLRAGLRPIEERDRLKFA